MAVDDRDKLRRLRKVYRAIVECNASDNRQDRQSRLSLLSGIITTLRLWRFASCAVPAQNDDEGLTRDQLRKLPFKELAKRVDQLFYKLSKNVPSGQIAPPAGNYSSMISLIAKNADLFDDIGSRTSGYFYQFFSECDRKRAQTLIESGDKQTNKEDLIAFTQIYTPDYVADFLLKNTACLSRKEALSLLDPSCGSGHFLLRAFDLLLNAYTEKGLSANSAAEKILTQNLTGADIDEVALWICGTELLSRSIEVGCEIEALIPQLANVSNKCASLCDSSNPELGTLRREWEAPHLLSGVYDVVVTNPPYIGRRLLDRNLKVHLRRSYPDTCHDLSAAFLQRGIELLKDGGRLGFITQASILYLPSYADFRRKLLTENRIIAVAELGTRVFPLQTGEKVNSILLIIEKNRPEKHFVSYFTNAKEQQDKVSALDTFSKVLNETDQAPSAVSRETLSTKSTKPPAGKQSQLALQRQQIATDSRGMEKREKEQGLSQLPISKNESIARKQSDFLQYHNCALSYDCPQFLADILKHAQKLGDRCEIKQGLATSDNARFLRYWWDVSPKDLGNRWKPYVKGAGSERWWAPVETVIDWGDQGAAIKQAVAEAYPYLQGKTHWVVKNENYYFRPGLTFSFITTRSFAARLLPEGCIFDVAGSSLFPAAIEAPAILGWLNSSFASLCAALMNPTVNMQVGDVRNMPILDALPPEIGKAVLRVLELKRKSSPMQYLDYFCRNSNRTDTLLHNNSANQLFETEVFLEQLHKQQASIDSIEEEIDEIVLTTVENAFALSRAHRAGLRQMADELATKRKTKTIMDGRQKALILLQRALAHAIADQPFMMLVGGRDTTIENQVSKTVPVSKIEALIGENLAGFLKSKFTREIASIYHGYPPMLVVQRGDTSLLLSVSGIRAIQETRELVSQFAACTYPMTDTFAPALDHILNVYRQPDWTAAELYARLKTIAP